MGPFVLFLSVKTSEPLRKLEDLVISRYPSMRREVQSVWVEQDLTYAVRLVKALGMHYHVEPQLDLYLAEMRREGAAIGEYFTFFCGRGGICILSEATFRVICGYLGQKEPCLLLQFGESAVWITEQEYYMQSRGEDCCESPAIPIFLPISSVVERVIGHPELVQGLEALIQGLYQWVFQALESLQQATMRELDHIQEKIAYLVDQSVQHIQAYRDQLSEHTGTLHQTLHLVSLFDTQPSRALTATKDSEYTLVPQLQATLESKLQQWQAFTSAHSSHFPVLYANSAKSEYAEMKVYVVNFKPSRYFPAWICIEKDTGATETVQIAEGVRPGLQAIPFSDANHFQNVSKLILSLWATKGQKMHQISPRFEVSFISEQPLLAQHLSLPPFFNSFIEGNAPEFLQRRHINYPAQLNMVDMDDKFANWLSGAYGLELESVKYAVRRLRDAEKEISPQNVLSLLGVRVE